MKPDDSDPELFSLFKAFPFSVFRKFDKVSSNHAAFNEELRVQHRERDIARRRSAEAKQLVSKELRDYLEFHATERSVLAGRVQRLIDKSGRVSIMNFVLDGMQCPVTDIYKDITTKQFFSSPIVKAEETLPPFPVTIATLTQSTLTALIRQGAIGKNPANKKFANYASRDDVLDDLNTHVDCLLNKLPCECSVCTQNLTPDLRILYMGVKLVTSSQRSNSSLSNMKGSMNATEETNESESKQPAETSHDIANVRAQMRRAYHANIFIGGVRRIPTFNSRHVKYGVVVKPDFESRSFILNSLNSCFSRFVKQSKNLSSKMQALRNDYELNLSPGVTKVQIGITKDFASTVTGITGPSSVKRTIKAVLGFFANQKLIAAVLTSLLGGTQFFVGTNLTSIIEIALGIEALFKCLWFMPDTIVDGDLLKTGIAVDLFAAASKELRGLHPECSFAVILGVHRVFDSAVIQGLRVCILTRLGLVFAGSLVPINDFIAHYTELNIQYCEIYPCMSNDPATIRDYNWRDSGILGAEVICIGGKSCIALHRCDSPIGVPYMSTTKVEYEGIYLTERAKEQNISWHLSYVLKDDSINGSSVLSVPFRHFLTAVNKNISSLVRPSSLLNIVTSAGIRPHFTTVFGIYKKFWKTHYPEGLERERSEIMELLCMNPSSPEYDYAPIDFATAEIAYSTFYGSSSFNVIYDPNRSEKLQPTYYTTASSAKLLDADAKFGIRHSPAEPTNGVALFKNSIVLGPTTSHLTVVNNLYSNSVQTALALWPNSPMNWLVDGKPKLVKKPQIAQMFHYTLGCEPGVQLPEPQDDYIHSSVTLNLPVSVPPRTVSILTVGSTSRSSDPNIHTLFERLKVVIKEPRPTILTLPYSIGDLDYILDDIDYQEEVYQTHSLWTLMAYRSDVIQSNLLLSASFCATLDPFGSPAKNVLYIEGKTRNVVVMNEVETPIIVTAPFLAENGTATTSINCTNVASTCVLPSLSDINIYLNIDTLSNRQGISSCSPGYKFFNSFDQSLLSQSNMFTVFSLLEKLLHYASYDRIKEFSRLAESLSRLIDHQLVDFTYCSGWTISFVTAILHLSPAILGTQKKYARFSTANLTNTRYDIQPNAQMNQMNGLSNPMELYQENRQNLHI